RIVETGPLNQVILAPSTVHGALLGTNRAAVPGHVRERKGAAVLAAVGESLLWVPLRHPDSAIGSGTPGDVVFPLRSVALSRQPVSNGVKSRVVRILTHSDTRCQIVVDCMNVSVPVDVDDPSFAEIGLGSEIYLVLDGTFYPH
ncbi:MAG: hypothetical protein ABT940_03785, partial [Alphaproteobacteria bacterium]